MNNFELFDKIQIAIGLFEEFSPFDVEKIHPG